MTVRNPLSRARLRATAVVRTRFVHLLLSACFVWLCLIAARQALAQSAATEQTPSARGPAPSWRQSRRRDLLARERLAQTPASPEYEYDPNYQYDSASEPEGDYDYAVESEGPIPDEGQYAGEGFEDYGPYEEGSGYDEMPGGHGCHGFSCHGFYVRADYLLWWGKGFASPPLVTTSVDGTPRDEAGILGLPTTAVLFPHGNFANTIQNGGRVRLGYWLDPCDTAAIEGTYFAFGKSTTHFNASEQDYPILARPFVNIETNAVGNDAELVAYPGLFSGDISVIGSSRLQGAEVIFRHALCRGCDWRVDCLIGWRFNRLDESLVISDNKEVLSGQTGLTVGTVLSEYDRFSTTNYFNGVQLGVITERRHCRWWFETRSTLALGNNRSIVNINGQATAVVPLQGGGEQIIVTPAGLLAQSTNIGQYTNDEFAIVPQLGLSIGYELTCGLWATVGYNFMYWSRVARPGDQIDTDVNLSQLSPGGLVGLPRPAFTDAISDYWAQGLNFGLAYRY